MDNELKNQTKILEEILKWIKIGSIGKVKEILQKEFHEKNKILVYHLSDGQKNVREICRFSGVKSTNTISNYWNKWKKMGIVEVIPVKGGERIRKIFELKDFDIEIPKIVDDKKEIELKEAKDVSSNGTMEESNDFSSGN